MEEVTAHVSIYFEHYSLLKNRIWIPQTWFTTHVTKGTTVAIPFEISIPNLVFLLGCEFPKFKDFFKVFKSFQQICEIMALSEAPEGAARSLQAQCICRGRLMSRHFRISWPLWRWLDIARLTGPMPCAKIDPTCSWRRFPETNFSPRETA